VAACGLGDRNAAVLCARLRGTLLRPTAVLRRCDGVDIGTAANQWNDGGMPSKGEDICKGNKIYNNYIRTKVAEGRGGGKIMRPDLTRVVQRFSGACG